MKPPLLYAGDADWLAAVSADCVHPDWRRDEPADADCTDWEADFYCGDMLVKARVYQRPRFPSLCHLDPTYVLPWGVPVVCPSVTVPLHPSSCWLSVWRVLGSDRYELGELFAPYLDVPQTEEDVRQWHVYLGERLPDDWVARVDRYWRLCDEQVGRLQPFPTVGRPFPPAERKGTGAVKSRRRRP